MLREQQLYLENMRKYLANRPRYPLDDLARYAGAWVAWSPDGTRIVASSTNPDDLDALVQAAGEDPLQCVVEGIPEADSLIGGGIIDLGSVC